MKKVVLISCVSKKLDCKAKAEDLYISSLFKFALAYAKKLNPDMIFILSAKYGLLPLEKEILPYNQTLKTMSTKAVAAWASEVLIELKKAINLEKDEVIFLCGEKYRKHLIPQIQHYQVPMKGLGIGKQLQYLKNKINE